MYIIIIFGIYLAMSDTTSIDDLPLSSQLASLGGGGGGGGGGGPHIYSPNINIDPSLQNQQYHQHR